jgi:tetratricopeptide (TPR) repeat protein
MKSRRILLNILFVASLVLSCILFVAGCRLPPFAPASPPKIALTMEEKTRITKEAALALENAAEGLYPDAAAQNYVGSVGARLVLAIPENHPRNYPFTFRVLGSKMVNAFAMPGGYVYVTRGLLEAVANEDQLAAVLAHQLAHITMGHFDSRAYELVTLDTGLGIRFPAESVEKQAPGAVSLPDGIVLALNIRRFRFTMDDENQADSIAMQYLARTLKYNPRAVINVRQILDAVTISPLDKLRAWPYTHHASRDEPAQLTSMLKAKYPEYAGNGKGFIASDPAVAEMLKIEPAFEAFEEGRKQCDLGERMLRAGFPKNARERLEAAVKQYDAAISLAKENGRELSMFYSARGLAYYALFQGANDPKLRKKALDDVSDARRTDSQNFVARLFHGYFLMVDGFYVPASEDLVEAARLNPGGEYGSLGYFRAAQLYDTAAFDGHDTRKAARYYELCLALDPLGPEAPAAKERLKALKPDSPMLKILQ